MCAFAMMAVVRRLANGSEPNPCDEICCDDASSFTKAQPSSEKADSASAEEKTPTKNSALTAIRARMMSSTHSATMSGTEANFESRAVTKRGRSSPATKRSP